MRSDELIDRARKAAGISTVAAWPSWPDSRILNELTERHMQMMAEEEIRARAGYGVQWQFQTCVVGQQMYPVPSRAIGGSFEKLEILLPNQVKWLPLVREDVYGSEEFDFGITQPGQPMRYVVEDGFVRLLPSPSSAFAIRFAYYVRPSQIVTSQCSVLGGDAADRGRITAFNPTLRTVVVNAIPKDMLAVPPAVLGTGNYVIDIIRPSGTFALSMLSVPAAQAFGTFTLAGTESLARVQIGDYVRIEDQSDWPMGLPLESHRMVANRAAMEIAAQIGIDEKAATIGQVVDADMKRFRNARSPQVKSQPKVIPLIPMSRRR